MADRTELGPFVAEDSFLRRIDRKRYVSPDGVIASEVFRLRAGELSLSFTYQDADLRTDAGLDRYQAAKALPSGDIPGICRLTYSDLTEALVSPLEPRHEPVANDQDYGHLHCATDGPRDEMDMERMAKLATRNGLIRPFIRSK